MEEYENLINRKIDIILGKDIINTFEFIKIRPIGKQMVPFLGKTDEIFECHLRWNKIMPGAYPTQIFYKQLFEDLLKKGVAICPGIPSLYYSLK